MAWQTLHAWAPVTLLVKVTYKDVTVCMCECPLASFSTGDNWTSAWIRPIVIVSEDQEELSLEMLRILEMSDSICAGKHTRQGQPCKGKDIQWQRHTRAKMCEGKDMRGQRHTREKIHQAKDIRGEKHTRPKTYEAKVFLEPWLWQYSSSGSGEGWLWFVKLDDWILTNYTDNVIHLNYSLITPIMKRTT